MNGINPVLAQMLGRIAAAPDADAATGPPTPMRQMRRALGRAADKAVGLSSSVLGIAEEDLDAETVIETGPTDWVVLGLRDGSQAGLTGLFLVDLPLRSALVDMQTMGNLLPPSDTQRAVTRTDAVMVMPFADQLLKELADVGFAQDGLDLAGYDIGHIGDMRTAGLVMVQGQYRCWRITVQLGGGDHQGEIMIALRPRVAVSETAKPQGADWSAQLRDALSDAPAELVAVLTRMKMPINQIEDFKVGQILHLAGTTVGSVTLRGPSGEAVATARLGQVAGKRAVRVEAETVHLWDAPPRMAAPEGAMPSPSHDVQPDPVAQGQSVIDPTAPDLVAENP